jgi:hypothetical protein
MPFKGLDDVICEKTKLLINTDRCENLKSCIPNIKLYDNLFGDVELLHADRWADTRRHRHDEVKIRDSASFRCKRV